MSTTPQSVDWFSTHFVEKLPAAVYVCDMNANVVAFNERAVELWGRSPHTGSPAEKFCGSQRMFLPSGTHLPHDKCPMEAVLRTGCAAQDEEVVLERPDGSRVTVLISIKPLFDGAGVQVGAVNCFQDVSKQKRAEHDRLIDHEAQERRRKAHGIGQLVGGVAHDFNNLLAPIIGNLDMLSRRGGRGVWETRQLQNSMLSAQRAKALVQQLLCFAQKQRLQPRAVDLGQLIRGLSDRIEKAAGSKVALVWNLAPDLPLVRVDGYQLDIAIINLVLNARDAMPDGGTLTISTIMEQVDSDVDPTLEGGTYVSLALRDTGIGMDEETLNRACEPFFSCKDVGQGSGLGLSMAEGLARQSGGALYLISALGRGTTVKFFLPLGSEPITAPSVPKNWATRACDRLLLVDDEPLVRECTAEMLKDLGYEVIEARSAEEALSVLVDDPNVDAVLTDYLMPGLSGADLAKELQERGFAVPVLIVSGYAPPLRISSDQPFLTKPVLQAELAAHLKALIEGTPMPQRGSHFG